MLSAPDVESFVERGFVCLRGAFPRAVADACRAILWRMILGRMTGLDPADRSTWTRPVIRITSCAEPPFVAAANTPALVAALDQLVGEGRWIPRYGLGTFPIRFPHPDDPGDAGWHVDASFTPPGATQPWLNIRSRGRALLMLFLLSDTGPDDAPTRIKVGSHLDVAPVLAEAGDAGLPFMELCQRLDARGLLDSARPVEHATGAAGDVYLCHPFLVHAAQVHCGREPRFMAQPPLDPRGELDLERADPSPVERAVKRALGR